MRENVSQTGTYKATLTQNTTAKMPAGVWDEPEAPWFLARLTGDGQRPSRCLINIYVFMYILLGEGGVYVIFILTYAGVRDMPPCCNTDIYYDL